MGGEAKYATPGGLCPPGPHHSPPAGASQVTPFGEKLRVLRAEKGVLQREMAAALAVSAAYLSALEHGRRGAPSAGLIHQICEYFGLIWDDADELRALAKLSRPRLKLNAAGLTAQQTALGNRVAKDLRNLNAETVAEIHRILDAALPLKPVARRGNVRTTARRAKAGRGL